MILQNMTSGKQYVILNAFTNKTAFAKLNMTQYSIEKYPEVNPVEAAGFDVGLWKCLVILAALTVALRILSLIFLRLLVTKFQ